MKKALRSTSMRLHTRRQNRYYKKVLREMRFNPRGLSKRERAMFGDTLTFYRTH